MLTLPIKKKWFDMILSGEKTEEYRENKPYWRQRLLRAGIVQNLRADMTIQLILRNGYSKDAPKAMIEVDGISTGYGNPEWGAEPGVVYLRLHIKRAVIYDET